MRRAVSLGMLLIFLAPLACRTTGPPVRPPPFNAVLSDSMTIYGRAYRSDDGAAGDTRVTARCRSCDSFAKRKRGDWVTTWYVARFDVVSVDSGTWPNAELSFICSACLPTIESGIMINIPPWPYMPGRVWIFELDTKPRPALIVDQYAPLNSEPEAAAPGEQRRVVEPP